MMAMSEREARAQQRAAVLVSRVERVAPDCWLVPSQSDPGVRYEVWRTPGRARRVRCSCVAAMHDRPWAHSAAVLAYERARQSVVAA